MKYYIVFAIVLLLVFAPITFLVLGSFSTVALPSDFSLSTLGLDNYIRVYSNPNTYLVFGSTIAYVGGHVWP
jgi:ABC-type sugar transport system permease subunit